VQSSGKVPAHRHPVVPAGRAQLGGEPEVRMGDAQQRQVEVRKNFLPALGAESHGSP